MSTEPEAPRHPLEPLFGTAPIGCAIHWLRAAPPRLWARELDRLRDALAAAADLPLLVVSQVDAGGQYPFPLDDSGPGLHTARASPASLGLHAAEALALSEDRPGRPVVVARTLQLHGPGLCDPAGALRPLLDALDAHRPTPNRVFSLIRTDAAVDRVRQLARRIAQGSRLQGVQLIGPAQSVRTASIAAAVAALTDLRLSIDRRTPDLRCEVPSTGPAPVLEEELYPTLTALGYRPRAARPSSALIPAIHPRLAPDRRLAARAFDILSRRQLSNQGPNARSFEARVAERTGAAHVVAVGSGSAALLVATRALGLRGAAVVPSFTFLATASAIVHAGLTPVFCDIDPRTWTLCPDALARLLSERDDVAMVLPVTTFGVPPELTRIGALAAEAGALVLHDACHAIGSTVEGTPVLGLPGLHTLSLHATKVLSAIEGGLVCTDDAQLAAEVRKLANYGFPPGDRRAALPAFNFHFDELRAEIGHHSLDRLDATLAHRARIAARYRAAGRHLHPQHIPHAVRSGFQEVGMCFPAAEQVGIDAILAKLASHGVEGRRYFYPALHEVAALPDATLPATERVVSQVLCLPLHPHMPTHSVDRVVAALEAL